MKEHNLSLLCFPIVTCALPHDCIAVVLMRYHFSNLRIVVTTSRRLLNCLFISFCYFVNIRLLPVCGDIAIVDILLEILYELNQECSWRCTWHPPPPNADIGEDARHNLEDE